MRWRAVGGALQVSSVSLGKHDAYGIIALRSTFAAGSLRLSCRTSASNGRQWLRAGITGSCPICLAYMVRFCPDLACMVCLHGHCQRQTNIEFVDQKCDEALHRLCNRLEHPSGNTDGVPWLPGSRLSSFLYDLRYANVYRNKLNMTDWTGQSGRDSLDMTALGGAALSEGRSRIACRG